MAQHLEEDSGVAAENGTIVHPADFNFGSIRRFRVSHSEFCSDGFTTLVTGEEKADYIRFADFFLEGSFDSLGYIVKTMHHESPLPQTCRMGF